MSEQYPFPIPPAIFEFLPNIDDGLDPSVGRRWGIACADEYQPDGATPLNACVALWLCESAKGLLAMYAQDKTKGLDPKSRHYKDIEHVINVMGMFWQILEGSLHEFILTFPFDPVIQRGVKNPEEIPRLWIRPTPNENPEHPAAQ